MNNLKLLIVLFVCSLIISVPSFLRIPRLLPFLQADVRRDAAQAVDMLNEQGLWLVGADIESIERTEDETCFTWEYAYRSRCTAYPDRTISTCIDAP